MILFLFADIYSEFDIAVPLLHFDTTAETLHVEREFLDDLTMM